jgi:hypothetical protein
MKQLFWVLVVGILPMRSLGQQVAPADHTKHDRTIAPFAREAVETLKADQIVNGLPNGRFSTGGGRIWNDGRLLRRNLPTTPVRNAQ